MLKPYYQTILGTDLRVSPAGFGTVKIGRNSGVKYPTTFDLPDDKTVKNLLAQAQDVGVNLLDTAPAYGSSESRLGQLIDDRHDWVICTKVGETFANQQSTFDFSIKAVEASVERSLNNLKTDYLDIVLIHSDGNDMDILGNAETVDALHRLKASGKVRAIGLSGKTSAGGIAALTTYDMDIAMITYNLGDQSERGVIDTAAIHQKSIFVKKAFASGHLQSLGDNPVQQSLDFIFASPIASVVLGTINPVHLQENVQAIVKAINNAPR